MLLKFVVAFLFVVLLSDALKLDLYKDEPKHLDLLRQGKFAEFRQWKENHRQSLTRRFGNLASGTSKIQEYDGRTFKVNATFGTPPQNFMLALDTYNSYTLIPDKTVVGRDNKTISDKVDTFDSSKSSTYIKGDGSFGSDQEGVKGFYGIDTVSLGDSNEVAIKNATFGQLTKLVTDPDFFVDKFDGILGLGIGTFDEYTAESIILTAVKENVIDKPIYTIWIDRNSPDVLTAKGLVTIGKEDTDHCDSNVVYTPINRKDWFSFEIDAVSLNNGDKQTGNWTVLLEISGYYSIIPQEYLDALVQSVNGQYDSRTGLYTVDCNAKFQASIFFGNNQLTMDEKTGIVKLDDFDSCFLAFEGSFGSEEFMLGEPFSQAYCTVHDVSGEKVGFAKNL